MASRFVEQWIADLQAATPLRANSLIVTVYGDSIAPHGGTVWLGDFIRLVEPFGINPRMVRTAVFRLSREGWLAGQQVGRRSHYSITAAGQRRFEHAYRRIYHAPVTAWDGRWLLVFTGTPGIAPVQREALRRELLWQGYGALAPGVMGHPDTDERTLLEVLDDAGLRDRVLAMRAESLGEAASRPLRELARSCWNLEDIAALYAQFVKRFRPLLRAMAMARELDARQCFLVRTLLIHEFRRILLRDPQLPPALLPDGWPGAAARSLCADIYRLTHEFAERHLSATLESPEGALPPAAPYFYERFGGLAVARRAANAGFS